MMRRNFGKILVLAVVASLVALTAGLAAAAPPGLARAIEAQEAHTDALLAKAGVVGTAVGLNGGGQPIVLILTERGGIGGLPGSLDGVAVQVRVTGKITALHHRPGHGGGPGGGDNGDDPPPPTGDCTSTTGKFRPACIGISTGHPDITAGTIGARVKNGSAVYALSNNHVYANKNNANKNPGGDNVLQPGDFDGGVDPDDAIGTLEDFEPIDFNGGNNVIDAAIALSSTANLGNATPSEGYGTPALGTVGPAVGLKVQKYGRTTGLTKGRVGAINATVNVGYGGGQVARFVNQLVVIGGSFSAGGDSGSLVVMNGGRDSRKAVGLLFAGGANATILNPIGEVLTRFGVTIDGQ